MVFLNAIFHLLHLSIILASLTLCYFESLVVYHLILQATILSSWVIAGPLMNKPGVCLLTELQKKLGVGEIAEFPDSYIVYLCRKFGYKGDDIKKINTITFSIFAFSTSVSLIGYFSAV